MLPSFSPAILAAVPDLSSMADKKISTIILQVDVDCSSCVKKINKTLKKYPEIQTQILNHEKKTVTISGPFDPEKLMKCICCRAGKYIKSYVIVIPPLKPITPPPKPITTQPKIEPNPVCCRQCWHGWAPHLCPVPICVCLFFEGYEASLCSSPYVPQCICRGEESTCRIM